VLHCVGALLPFETEVKLNVYRVLVAGNICAYSLPQRLWVFGHMAVRLCVVAIVNDHLHTLGKESALHLKAVSIISSRVIYI